MSAQGHVVAGSAAPLGRYPHAKVAGDLIYVSGTSSRRPDGSHRGVSTVDGVVVRDVAEQTRGTLENIAGICNDAGNIVGLMPHPERAIERILGSADGVVLVQSLLDSAAACQAANPSAPTTQALAR